MSSPSIVQLARPGDESKVFDFFVKAHADNGFFDISAKKVIDVIMRACRHEFASIGLIKDYLGNIEAATGLSVESAWYSDSMYLGEMLNYVDVNHRRSKHAQALLKFQKDTADILSKTLGYPVPIFPSIMTRKRLEPKMRLFQREFDQIGAIFIYEPGAHPTFVKPEDEFTNQRKLETPKHRGTAHRDFAMAAAG